MTKKEEYEKKTEDLLLPLLEENNFELVDVEYVKEGSNWFLRAYIDKEGGITVDDCELISRALSDLLDVHDYIPDSYILEVSSPGLGRQLKKERDFQRSLGEEVDVKLYKAVEKQKEFTGLLEAFDEETITIELEDGTQKQFLRKDIAMVRLTLDF
jgi:ribosome maturation factor RimP